jgi:quercetin dioxygenase-like cupin family protein
MTRPSDHELALELVLGLLDPETHAAARMRALEDPAFAALVREWEERMAPLALRDSVDPPPGLLEKIEQRIASAGADLPGTLTRRHGTGEWIAVAPGLRIKILNRNEKLNRQTIMVDLAAGGEYTDHDHSQDEEIYMISGDLIIGELVLGPGDFHVARAGRRHPVHRTRSGCVCIISQAIDW